MKIKNKMVVAVDLGSSITKGFYKSESGTESVKYMLMGSECFSLPEESVKYLHSRFKMGFPEDNAWIRASEDGETIAVGRMAREYSAYNRIKPLKAATIVPKLLAYIGAIAEKEKLDEAIELNLGLLLPYGELSAIGEIEKNLISALNEFYFCNRKYSVKINRLRILPEASGVALLQSLKDLESFRKIDRGFLMLGHRNTSFLVFERGSFSTTKSDTTIHGFYKFVEKFKEKVPGLENDDVFQIIQMQGKVDYDWQKDSYKLEERKLVFDLTALKRLKMENFDFKSPYQASLEEYSRLILSWLDEKMPSNIRVLFCLGGATPFLIDKIKAKFPDCAIERPTSDIDDLWKALNFDRHRYPEEFVKENLLERMMDVWSLFAIVGNIYKEEEVLV